MRDQYGNSTGAGFSIYVDGIEARADGIRDFYVTPGQAAELKVNTMAPENSRLKYTWYEGDVDEGTIIEGADSNVYRIDSVMKNSPYSCKVEDLNGNSSKTVEFNVYVVNKLEAYVDGTKKDWVTICTPPGEETVLKVSATAVDSSQLKYTWIGYEFSIEDERIIEGADSAEYRPGNVTGSYNYRCVVSDQYGNSKDVDFEINQLYAYADEEGNQETDLHVSPGEAAELKVFAGAEDPSRLTYTWYIRTGEWEDDIEEIKGAEENVLRIESISKSQTYCCKVYDPSPYSYYSYTWVSYNVIIDNQLKAYAYGTKKKEVDTYVPYGESAELKVSATAADSSQLTYVWYKDYEAYDNIIEGAASSVVKTDPISQNDQYICVVSDQYGNSQKIKFLVHVDNKLEAYVDGTKETSAYMTVTPGETVDLKVAASALDADHLTYEWGSCEYNDFEEVGAEYVYRKIGGSNTPILRNVAVRNYRRDLYCDVSDPYGNEVRIYFHINSLKNSDPIEVFCDDVVRARILPYPQSDAIYKFTPQETAEYIFYFTDGFWSNSLDLLDEQMHYIGQLRGDGDHFDNHLKTTLEAGKTYYLIVYNEDQFYNDYGVKETNMHIELFTGISPLTIEAQDISISASEFVYDGKAKTPAVTVSHDGTVLEEGTDYEVSYRNNINAGTATVTVTGIGNYTGTNSITFLIKAVGWIQENGEWFYYNNNGSKLVNGWAKDSTGWCWMDASGKITKNKWILSGGQWYYLKPNGYMAANEWAKDSTGWCWMDASGKITKNKWILSGGQWYYLKANGYMAANEWAKDSGGWYWMDASGKITKNKWIQTGGKWYYLGANGYMVTGTQKIGGKTYKFNSSGVWIQ